jgi:CheY-like chemotaxis protein
VAEAPARRAMAAREATILLVDDDDDVRESLSTVLEASGFRVLAAAGAKAALKLIAAEARIDLLLTDIRMPGYDGVQLAREVARAQPALKVLFISGYPGPTAAGIDQSRLISKPIRPSDLVRRVRRALLSPDAEH